MTTGAESICSTPHQQVHGCVLCKLEDANEALRYSNMALRSESGAFNAFIEAARKFRESFDELKPDQVLALPESICEALSEFEDAIPCPECHGTPCGCPNV